MTEPPVGIWSRQYTWDGPAARRWALDHQVGLWVALGAIFRVAQFLAGRSLWLDEGSLLANAVQLSPRQFFGPLIASQLAPPGFLVLEWAAIRVIPALAYGGRVVPLVAGLVALGLFPRLARHILPARGVPLAVALFASADELIYFSSEAKQYSSDVLAAVVCLLLGLTIGSGRLDARRAATLTLTGGLVVWFSHPSGFVLAAVGLVGLAGRARTRDFRGAAWWVAVGAVWVLSLVAVRAVAMRQLDHQGMMWRFWGFAFPPAPVTLWDASWVVRRGLFFFSNPLEFSGLVGYRASALVAACSALVGAFWLGRTRPDRLALVVLPAGLALLASALRLYPFHGRLLLFLVPMALLLIAGGLDRARDLPGTVGRWVWVGLVTLLVVVPTVFDLGRVFEPRDRPNQSPFGDRRPNALNPYRFPF